MDKLQFIEEMADMLSVEIDDLQMDVSLDSLEDWDSLAVIGYLALLDKKIGKKVDFSAVKDCKVFGDLVVLAGF
jgi:acyl carrier protein